MMRPECLWLLTIFLEHYWDKITPQTLWKLWKTSQQWRTGTWEKLFNNAHNHFVYHKETIPFIYLDALPHSLYLRTFCVDTYMTLYLKWIERSIEGCWEIRYSPLPLTPLQMCASIANLCAVLPPLQAPSHNQYVHWSLPRRPCPAFHHLHYGKVGRG